MDFDTKIWDEVFPEQDLETIATLYEHQAMVDGPKLPARTSNVKSAQNSSLQ